MRKPTNIRITDIKGGKVFVKFTYFSPAEEIIFSEYINANNYDFNEVIEYRCEFYEKGKEKTGEHRLWEEGDCFTFNSVILMPKTTYILRMRAIIEGRKSEWSDVIEFTTPEFSKHCDWKEWECPLDLEKMRYDMDEKNLRIATKTRENYPMYKYCTVVTDTTIPLNAVTSWSIKVLKSKSNDCGGILIGVAPYDINHDFYDRKESGWYFYCYKSILISGPPHNYSDKIYGPRKEDGQYVHNGDSVGVVMDTEKGDLSFILNNVNFGVAYCGIPLDEPLVPCVLLEHEGDSIELVI